MSVLSKVTTGRQRKPLTVCVWGVPGVGKSSFASAAPRPIVFDLEEGSTTLDVARITGQRDWETVVGDLRELTTEDHGYQTMVVDTLDALEALAISHVLEREKKATLADFAWGAGYALLVQEWRLFLRGLEVLRSKRGMNIVLVAHEHRKSVSDPELGSYEMYRPKLNERVWALTNEWCDAVLFAQFDQALFEKEGQKNRAIVTGRRVLRTTRGTGFVAKNRFGLPPTIDLDWRSFEAAAQPVPIEALRERLQVLLGTAPGEVVDKVNAWLKERGETPETLRAAAEKLEKNAAQAA